MKIFGLCGGSGSGKTAAARFLIDSGLPVLSADDIYHEMISYKSPCVSKIADAFGSGVLTKDGLLNRKNLADIVFEDQNKLFLLNSITHPLVIKKVRELIYKYDEDGLKSIVVDMPAMYESGYYQECYQTVCVYAPKKLRVRRIMMRDALTLEDAERRVNAQISSDFLADKCDHILYNTGSLYELKLETLSYKFKFYPDKFPVYEFYT